MSESSHVPPPAREPDASMSLLNQVIRSPLDPGYRLAADRRARTGARRRTPAARALLALVALALGLATTTATIALRAPEPSVLAARSLLEDQITERTAAVEQQQLDNAALAQEIAALQSSVLALGDSALGDQLAADSVLSGATAVTGPGLRLELSDAPVDGLEVDPNKRVQDVDLQIIVNGLWAAGAEAIAVNEQRLTATTAIRTAGSAILVDLSPLIGPYVVTAIGDSAAMQTRLARTSAGQHLATLQTTYEIGTEMSAQRELTLPAARLAVLRSASVPAGVPLLSTGAGGPVGTGSPTGAIPPRQDDDG